MACASGPPLQAGEALPAAEAAALAPVAIDRHALVRRHDPVVKRIDPDNPLTLGNGRFAFTADVTGLQSFADLYFRQGIPLETKARWAWHSRPNPENYTLADVSEKLRAYGREVAFPVATGTPAAEWLRQNPHDLPLARIAFEYDGGPLDPGDVGDVDQRLDLWSGRLESRWILDGAAVRVQSAVHDVRDLLAVRTESALAARGRLSLVFRFPRGYDPAVKNTPDLDWDAAPHATSIASADDHAVLLRRRVDVAEHHVRIAWRGDARFVAEGAHVFRLVPADESLDVSVEFLPAPPASDATAPGFDAVRRAAADAWERFWRSGGALDFGGSTDPRAAELERRVVLSRYLLQAQARARQPAQETGLTSSSWYGKHHSEMTFWHAAHWVLWGNPRELERVLDWYAGQLPSARALAKERGLDGARWAKMVGPDNRESPGGNPLIAWNQPQFIHLAEMLYRADRGTDALERYRELVLESAAAMASMLSYDAAGKRWELGPPIWIAQEIYAPGRTRNPAFELAYWRAGLDIAGRWRARLELPPEAGWQERMASLAGLPQKAGRYVAIESIPDTWDDAGRRIDHPTMLAPFGFLDDPTVDRRTMQATLDAVLAEWDFQAKIWGWDYPMIAMTAARLGRPEIALDILLADAPHNRWLANGHCPQPGADLPVYLPANGALLTAVAMLAAGWDGAPDRPAPGFPANGRWAVRSEGLLPYVH
ncbi:MAG TPA: hypothetical protein VFY03_13335 [Woeseiaceae bacterium]|nr:hypothetical protein [Woeseiaceae bacterium]